MSVTVLKALLTIGVIGNSRSVFYDTVINYVYFPLTLRIQTDQLIFGGMNWFHGVVLF